MPPSGGFGGGPWGGGPWGGAALAGLTDVNVADTVPVADSLAVYLPLQVDAALALSPFLVLVTFSHHLDTGYAPNFQTTSYSIAGLIVLAVGEGPNAFSVVLTTDEQGPFNYTVVVSDARSTAGDPIDPFDNSALFAGWPIIPTFFATAQSRTKVQFTFSAAMLQNAAYTDPASYTFTDMNGVNLPILSVTAVGTSPNQRLALELGTDLVPGGYYVATIISLLVQNLFTVNITPNTDLFQWNEAPRPVTVTPIHIKLSNFTGEVTGGLLGQPLGQIFFSPSLEAVAPNSSIQVDEVSVCTRAFDVYTPPSPPDPNPLYTFSTGGPSGTLGGAVLWARFDRLLGAQINLGLNQTDNLGLYADGPAVAILAEPFDPAYISLLNNSFWTTFDGVGTPFITANNLGPIPPGPITVITLQGLPVSILEDGYGGDGWGAENWG
jgi:hypothetical protein